MKKENIKNYLAIFGLLLLAGYSIVLTITFLVAYFHPSYSTLVLINFYGEAHFEFVLLCITVPLGLWAVYHSCKNLFTKKETVKL